MAKERTPIIPPPSVEYSVFAEQHPDARCGSQTRNAQLDVSIHVQEGVVHLQAGADEFLLEAEDGALVPAGVPYRRCNAGEVTARWKETFSRA